MQPGQVPFHVFEAGGRLYLLDIGTSRTLRCTEAAYKILEPIEKERLELLDLLHTASYMPDVVRKELLRLNREGFFRHRAPWNEDRVSREISRVVARPLSGIQLFVAEGCNLRCRYCYVPNKLRQSSNGGRMDARTAARSLDCFFGQTGSIRELQVTFMGGEPLLNKEVILWVVDRASARSRLLGKRMHFSLSTNGTLLDDEMIAAIKRHDFGLLISADGPPEAHDAARVMASGEGSFELMARNVKNLMAVRRRVSARATLSESNRDPVRVVEFLEDFGFSAVRLSTAYGRLEEESQGSTYKEVDETSARHSRELLRQRAIAKLRGGKKPVYDAGIPRSVTDFMGPPVRGRDLIRCGVGKGTATVDPSGDIYPCHRYVGLDGFALGNVHDGGISSRLLERYLRGIAEIRTTKCAHCWAIYECGGLCPWRISRRGGGFLTPPEEECTKVRRGIEEWIDETARLIEEEPELSARWMPT